ncbi:hypothetical protein M758_4G093200 [Ceratodon purpureus]|nr:hypothetical protein M758_4G093200 [Ceratodon purpureus]
MASLLHASAALSAKRRETLIPNASLKTLLQCSSVSSFSGTTLENLSWNTKPCTRSHTSGRSGVARASKLSPVLEKRVRIGEHCLDNVSNYIFHQLRKPFAKYIPDDWDPLDFLPVNIQSNLQKSEALATLVVREILVFVMVYIVYEKVEVLCRWLYGMFTRKQRNGQPIDDEAYAESPFRAARQPVRSLVLIWASTRLLWITSVLWKMQAVITPAVIYKLRAVSIVCTISWFFFRWKRLYVEHLIVQKPLDESRILVIDKLLSLAMYGLAAACIAEVLGLALNSLLAVGGVSGLAVGLAAKEVVGNMFGGASLFISRPFVIGEKIKVDIKAGSVSGRVQDIGFMQTKVQGFDGVPVLVPNQAFTSQVITNFSRAKTKVLEASFQLNNRHIFLVHDITTKVQKYLSSQPSVESMKATPICYLQSMEKDGPVIALSCVIKAVGGEVFYRYQQEILIQVAHIITDILGPDSPFTPIKVPNSDTSVVSSEGLVM